MSKTAHSTLNLSNHSRILHPTPSNERVRNAMPSLFMATIQPSQHRGDANQARSDAHAMPRQRRLADPEPGTTQCITDSKRSERNHGTTIAQESSARSPSDKTGLQRAERACSGLLNHDCDLNLVPLRINSEGTPWRRHDSDRQMLTRLRPKTGTDQLLAFDIPPLRAVGLHQSTGATLAEP